MTRPASNSPAGSYWRVAAITIGAPVVALLYALWLAQSVGFMPWYGWLVFTAVPIGALSLNFLEGANG